jgi:hypothetical protein
MQRLDERMAIMGNVLAEITTAGYIYDLTKGFYQWPDLPPPKGTRINCRAAANLAKRLAEEKRGLEGTSLKVIGFTPKDGFIVLATPGIKALGSTQPEINTPTLKCWEFDNHYRVQDPIGGNKVYDPIFGTSGNFNPEGILASSPTQSPPGESKMTTIYGEKYQITRGIGVPTEVIILHTQTVDQKYIVGDSNFQ